MIGRKHAGKRINLYVADLNVWITTSNGKLRRRLEIDPTLRYRGLDKKTNSLLRVHRIHDDRRLNTVGEGGLEPPRSCEHWHLKPARLPFRHSPG
jgi:hypothetical protein